MDVMRFVFKAIAVRNNRIASIANLLLPGQVAYCKYARTMHVKACKNGVRQQRVSQPRIAMIERIFFVLAVFLDHKPRRLLIVKKTREQTLRT